MTARPRALIDQDIQPADRFRMQASDCFDLSFGVEPNEDAVIEALDGRSVLFTTSRVPVTERVLREAGSLELVAKVGTGIDSIDLATAEELGVGVIYTPGFNALSVAEHALALLLAVSRNVVMGCGELRAGGWRDTMPTSCPVTDTTVGIVGFGRVGSRLAGLLDGFNVELLAHDPYVEDIKTDITGATLVGFEELLEASDSVIVTAELTEETRGMFDAEAFDRMSTDAVLVNTARGPVVDTDALVVALDSGKLGGAGLDVFETEPLPVDSPLHDYENVVVTPHLAASSVRARTNIIDTLVANARPVLNGRSIDDRFIAVAPNGRR
ncbi:NAD(P)-dependent oxidoreductase [Halegenticoccus tardaugens]|uniref:NAD(P)-dependent oxidoreductase n=1 Tax=Halegenticoccus tardaugens TaxID=2071624 RepID=UPI00100B5069|nr:NAD(P)-dependent oxidoreductase [Halegenticoccus tardaugens]